MKRLFGHLTLGVSLGVLLAAAPVGEVKGAAIYRITMAITDDTTSTTTVFTVGDGGANDTNPSPNGISVSAALNTSATGVSLTGINSTTTSTASSTTLNIGGLASVVSGSSDTYTIVITTTHDSYNLPTGITGTLGQSESGTYTYTNAGNTQGFQSWYNPGSAPDVTAGETPGPMSIAIPVTGSSTLSGSANTPGSTTFPGYIVPYTLTNQITIVVTGNDSANNSSVGFQASTTIMATTAVPEPASLVLCLTGMPVPLMIVGLLRRRKARRGVA